MMKGKPPGLSRIVTGPVFPSYLFFVTGLCLCLYLLVANGGGAGALGGHHHHHHASSSSFANKPVALRFVVISGGTRIDSLYRLVRSICRVLSEDDRLDLDVWIDVPEGANPVAAAERLRPITEDIVQLGKNGTYPHGKVMARTWHQHMGLRGQWLEAWHMSIPGGLLEDTKEVGLILEDDLELSPFSWRWLKAAVAAYGNDERVAGFTLQRAELCVAKCPNIQAGGPAAEGVGGAFFYPLVGTWGYAPTARSFSRFRNWFYALPSDFKPYVDGLSPTEWYQSFEQKGTEKKVSM
jgi:hypothetical protein